ncbi:MAG: TatD family hydrolase [Akkermansiaceae bacterium]|jgi:TatD DNase family protein
MPVSVSLTDSHCHLGSPKFSQEEIPGLIARAREAGVNRLITLATDEKDQLTNLALARDYEEVSACLGIHPCDVHETRDDFESLLTPYLDNPNVAAVGETGLDYFHPAPDGWSDEDYHRRQRDFLRRHFSLASSKGLNVVIHTRDRAGHASLDDALDIYRDFSSSVRAVFHCFPGPPELAMKVIDAGGLVSFTGIATFKNAQAVVETVKIVPADSFMLETDSPYLAPVPHRGSRCEPAYTRLTAEVIARHRGVSLEELAKKTEETVSGFFRFG